MNIVKVWEQEAWIETYANLDNTESAPGKHQNDNPEVEAPNETDALEIESLEETAENPNENKRPKAG